MSFIKIQEVGVYDLRWSCRNSRDTDSEALFSGFSSGPEECVLEIVYVGCVALSISGSCTWLLHLKSFKLNFSTGLFHAQQDG